MNEGIFFWSGSTHATFYLLLYLRRFFYRWSRRGQGRFGLGDQRAEPDRIAIRHIRQNLAIQIDAGLLEAIHEAAIRDLSDAAGGADAHNPQRPEVALFE